MLSDVTTTTMHRQDSIGCNLRPMEFSHDEQQISELKTIAFFRIRAMKPKLMPCSVGQKADDYNLWLHLPGSFVADNCHERYWKPNCDVKKGSRANRHVFSYYCRQCRRFENSQSTSQLAMQLVQGYFSYDEECVILCSRIFDETQKNGLVTGVESKLCISLRPENC